MKPMVGPDTLVVPLQNGVEAPYQLGEVLDPANVLGGLCAIVAFMAGPGHVKHSGANPLIRFGHLDNHADPRVNTLSEIFNHCSGVKSSIPDDVLVAMWQKFMLITPWSGLGAVSRAPLGVLLEQPETRELLIQATEEIYQLGLAREIDLPEDSVARTIKTLEDSELDAQNGAVVRLAHEVGLETPINRFLLYSLRSLELRARGALSFNRRSSPR
jgi:2-dehydropantoate 2-reductase